MEKCRCTSKTEELRVLLVTNEDPGRRLGGAGEFIGQMARQLRRLGADARVLLLQYRWDAPTPSDQVDYCLSPGPDIGASATESLIFRTGYQILARSIPLLKAFDPHVIHCNDRQAYYPFRALPNLLFSLHFAYSDLVGFPQLDDVWFQEYKIDRHALRNSPVSLVYSRYMAEKAAASISPGCKPRVLPLGGGELVPKPQAKPRAVPRVISFFGRFEPRHKGVIEYLEAARTLAEEESFAGIEFRLYSEAPPDMAGRYPAVRFMGFVRRNQRIKAYAESDAVVMPSRYEPFGLVGLEAMGAGCLLLAPTGLGMDEYLRPGTNALEIESHRERIAEVLRRAVGDWKRCAPLVEQGISDARQFTWRRCAQAHIDVYREYLPRKRCKSCSCEHKNTIKQEISV